MNLENYLTQFTSTELHIIGPLLAKVLDLKEPLIFIDGGAQFKKDDRGFSVGDGDSTTTLLDEYLDTNKNFSDLAYALQKIPAHYSEIYLHGFLGHRKDHELINLAEVHRFLSLRKSSTKCFLDQSVIAVSKGSWDFSFNGIFSLFAFSDVQLALSGNCKYPIKAPQTLQSLSSHGLSNNADGAIHLICDKPVLIFTNWAL